VATAADIPTRTLVLGMAREDGTIAGAELAAAAEACGVSGEQLRSCLRRLVAEGLLTRHGRGGDARFEATQTGMATLGTLLERTRLAYVQDAAGRGWDRQWRLVAFAVPEARRGDRDRFRARLRALGGAPVQAGLYASPHPWLKDVRAEATALGIAGHVAYVTSDDLEVAGERDPRELARRLWPVEDLGARYQAFVDRYADLPGLLERLRRHRRRITDAEFLPGALGMAVAFQSCFNDDPLLPPELLPRPWPGRAARQLLIRCRRMALAARQPGAHLPLFHLFDEALEAIP
jgi:phenylacetic acid degradation operon negative regulatory protein